MRNDFMGRKWVVGLALLLVSGVASAEYLGFSNGRTADLTRLPDLSVEGGFSTGDFGVADYQNIGLRVNYRLSPGLMFFGDLAMSEVGRADGTALGLGVFYSLEGIFENLDAAVKGGFHKSDYGRFYGELDTLSVEFLISGLSPLTSSGMMWFANIGLHRSDGGRSSETDLLLGGGLVLPLSTGEAYLGLDLIDEMVVGLGYRYFFE